MPPISAEQNFTDVSTGLSRIPSSSDLGVALEEPKSGGRKRGDGVEVKWKTARPIFERTNATPGEKNFPTGRLDAPFFCHDVTERQIRVPFNDERITTHPCGAVGIGSVQVLVPDSHIEDYAMLYAGILGRPVRTLASDLKEPSMRTFEIGVPNMVDKRPAFVNISSKQHYAPPDALPKSDEIRELSECAEAHLQDRGIGIYSITLRVAGGSNQGTDVALGTDAIGKTVRIERQLQH